jgi:hypothetical protein
MNSAKCAFAAGVAWSTGTLVIAWSSAYIVHGKGERWVELTPYESGSLQGRHDDQRVHY